MRQKRCKGWGLCLLATLVAFVILERHVRLVLLVMPSQTRKPLARIPEQHGATWQKHCGAKFRSQGQSYSTCRRAVAESAGGLEAVVSEQTTLTEVLTFLVCAVAIAPLSKKINMSPTLGFLLAGAIVGPSGLGLFADDESIKRLADIGILFLLFEQGLELSSDRLKQLSVYVFGFGVLQIVCTSLFIGTVAYFGGALALENLAQPEFRADLVASVERVDQIAVIAVSLSISSSAFVLKVLEERKLAPTDLGQASLGILLFQDIAVVPLLVLLPLIEDGSGGGLDTGSLATYAATALAGLAAIGFFGGAILRRLFDTVAETRSSDTFVSLCVLCVLGTAQFTETLGLSTTLGAFLAGTLLAESNYRTQVEADIAPFKGLLLGLFFLTTGAQVEPGLLLQEWQLSLTLLLGLVLCKSAIIAGITPLFNLSLQEGTKLGWLLAGGGEFAFVVFALASKFSVLPAPIIKLLTGVVVISMALTPFLAAIGEHIAGVMYPAEEVKLIGLPTERNKMSTAQTRVALICGMGPMGQQVASFLLELEAVAGGTEWLGLDLDPIRVNELRKLGQPVFFGDGSKLQVLAAAGLVAPPSVIVVTYADREQNTRAVERLRYTFPDVPILTHASSADGYADIRKAGVNPGIESIDGVGSADDVVHNDSAKHGVSVVSSVVETARRLGHAAIEELADIPVEVQAEWSQRVRQETERRLLRACTAAVVLNVEEPTAQLLETNTFLVRPGGPSALNSPAVWDLVRLGAKPAADSTAKILRYLESFSLLQTLSATDIERLRVALESDGMGGATSKSPLELRSFDAGEVIIGQGMIGDEMFIVEVGECKGEIEEGSLGGKQVVATYGPGDSFGELSVLFDPPKPHALTVTASADVQLLVVNRSTFDRVVSTGILNLQLPKIRKTS